MSGTPAPPASVLVVSDIVTATQVISFGQVFAETGKPAFVLQTDPGTEPQIAALLSEVAPQALILSRLAQDTGAVWIRLARQAGIPVIYHIDDDLLAVPESLGPEKYARHNAPDRLRALRGAMEDCDLIYASTKPLAGALRGHGIRTPIMSGDIYCSVDPEHIGRTVPEASGPVIGYMGTGGHAADLDSIAPALEQTMRAFPELQFECFGGLDIPPRLQSFANRVRRVGPVTNYADFRETMRALGWWIGLAPLQDTPFNRCKADTKWVEYSLSGMAVVATDLPVYRRACQDGAGILARRPEDWHGALSLLLTNPSRRMATAAIARNKLRDRYGHAVLRDQVLAVLDRAADLTGRPRAQRPRSGQTAPNGVIRQGGTAPTGKRHADSGMHAPPPSAPEPQTCSADNDELTRLRDEIAALRRDAVERHQEIAGLRQIVQALETEGEGRDRQARDRTLAAMQARIAELERERTEWKRMYDAIRTSTSWRISRPIRWLVKAWRR